jgi:hypothetical protein
VLNGVGGIATLMILLIVAITKFVDGAWVPLVVIPLIVLLFKGISHHYKGVAASLSVPTTSGRRGGATPSWCSRPIRSIRVCSMRSRTRARSRPTICWPRRSVADGHEAEIAEKRWAEHAIEVPLEVVRSAPTSSPTAMLSFIDEVEGRWSNSIVTVIIPELYVEHWWQHLCTTRVRSMLKGRLLFRKGTVVTSIPYRTQEVGVDPAELVETV